MSGQRKFLIFSQQDSLYAFDLSLVAEVGDPPRMSPVPLRSVCYAGAINFHGDIVAVLRFGLFLGLGEACQPGKIVVLHQRVASLAFIVDTVVRIVPEDDIALQENPDNALVAATFTLDGVKGSLFDLNALVQKAEIDLQKCNSD